MNKIEKVLLIGSGLWYLGEGMLGPLFTIFAEKIGGDVLQISWAWAVYLLVVGFLTIIFGKYSDRWNKEKMMIWGYALNAVFTFSYLLVANPLELCLVQAGLGIAAALATPTWDALFSKHENRKTGGALWGIADGMPPIVTAVAILIGGAIVNFYSFELLFLIMGTIQIIATLYQIKIFKVKS